MGLIKAGWDTNNRNKMDKALASIQKVSDPLELKKIAVKAPLAEVRLEAIKKIGDQQILKEIALQGRPFECSEAIARIHDVAILKEIVYSNAAYPWQAVLRITDQDELMDIAKTAPTTDARLHAVQQLANQDDLADLVFNMDIATLGNDRVIAAAVSKIDDPAILGRAAETYRPWRSNAKQTLQSIRKRKIRLAGDALKEGEYLILRCKECGKQIRAEEYWDSSPDGSWLENGIFRCSCIEHRYSSDGLPEEPAWEVSVCSEQPDGDRYEFCAVCMKPRIPGSGFRPLGACIHMKWLPGRDRDEVFNNYKTINIPYRKARW